MCTAAVSGMLKAVPGVESAECEKDSSGKPTGKVTVKTNKDVDLSAITKAVSGRYAAKVQQ
ncbi:MAG: hypothetical protein OER88_09815 [Planctomycetota bacterium]|nr:hypothetical protein [Planctomycetota bacterium]